MIQGSPFSILLLKWEKKTDPSFSLRGEQLAGQCCCCWCLPCGIYYWATWHANNPMSCDFGKRLRGLQFSLESLKKPQICFKQFVSNTCPRSIFSELLRFPVYSENILQSFDAFLIAASQSSPNQTSPKHL